MKMRITILVACASALALALTATATTDTFAKDEKTFLGGDASVGKAKKGKDAVAGSVVRPGDQIDRGEKKRAPAVGGVLSAPPGCNSIRISCRANCEGICGMPGGGGGLCKDASGNPSGPMFVAYLNCLATCESQFKTCQHGLSPKNRN
jgi:hypothetical protein